MPLDLNYHHLYYFWTTVRAGRVTAAARELHLSQSALSLQLMSLEKSLGRRLLERTRKGVELTAGGAEVYEHAERIFAAGARLSAAIKLTPGAQLPILRLGVTSALGREVAMAAMRALGQEEDCVPSVVIEPREDLRERLARRRLDAALAGTDLSVNGASGFRGRLLIALPMIFVASPRLERELGRFPKRGSSVRMLMRTHEHPMRARLDAYLAAAGVNPVPVAETEDADFLIELARGGSGVACLPERSVRDDIAAGRLRRVGPASTGLIHEAWLMVPSRPHADPRLAGAIARLSKPGVLDRGLR